MKKATDALAAEVKSASAVLIVLDARCPDSSFNPHLEKLFEGKPIIYVLNKIDMASQKITNQWVQVFQKKGKKVAPVSCKTGDGKKRLIKLLDKIKSNYVKNFKKKYKSPSFRLAVIGIPNTGKSSVINLLSPQKTVKTGKKPGLTRGKQWLKIKEGMEVLDSPGIAPPRLDGANTGWILGAIAAIKQEILPIEEVTTSFIRFLIKTGLYPDSLFVKGKPEFSTTTESETQSSTPTAQASSPGENPDTEKIPDQSAINKIIDDFAIARGFLIKGGNPDREKACYQVLKMFREGKFGKISLEIPVTEQNEEKNTGKEMK